MHERSEERTDAGTRILITCEHGGNRIPQEYHALFVGHEELLHSHRGSDPGALILARQMAQALGAPLIISTVSRLLVDLNRSPGHPDLYSEVIRDAPRAVRDEIFRRYYQPYRRRVAQHVSAALAGGAHVVHISSHSFTPSLKGHVRNADVAFLYDPARTGELQFSLRWLAALRRRDPAIRLRRNYPYTGRSDGFCTWLRRQHPGPEYVGIELEVNQRHVAAGGPAWRALRGNLIEALIQVLKEGEPGFPEPESYDSALT